MAILKQYQYKERLQRVWALLFAFLLHLCVGGAITAALVYAKTVFFYKPVFRSVIIFTMVFHLAGILAGSALFKGVKKSRWRFIAISFVTVASFILFALKTLLVADIYALFLNVFKTFSPWSFLLLGILPFLTGVLNNYFVKVLSGIYFDERKGTHTFIVLILLGLTLGSAYQAAIFFYQLPDILFIIPPVLALPFIFLVRLDYNPEPFFAKELHDHSDVPADEGMISKNDDLVFNYLNFLYIAIYTFLGLLTYTRHFGDMLYVKLMFIGVVFVSISLGFVLSSVVKKAFWHIYSEMYYPFFFIFFFIMLARFGKDLGFVTSVLFFVPLALTFGLTLFHTTKHILYKYEHEKSHQVFLISIFMVPLPILIALSNVVFTNRWFFIFFYVLAFLNIILPGIHLAGRRHSEFRKGLYFLMVVIVVPIFILMHIYFNIKLDKKLYVQYTKNYDAIYAINANASYFDVTSDIYLNNNRVMKISDQFIRNLRRAVLSLSLFGDNKKDDFLFIDGNRKFFENNLYEIYDNAECVDYVHEKQVDYQTLPIAGRKSIITFETDIFSHLKTRDRKYSFIVDIPNIYDQKFNSFRFTPTYYNYMKSYLGGKEVFVQFLQPGSANSILANNALVSFSASFKNCAAFFFGETLALIGTDKDSLVLDKSKLDNLNLQISRKKEYKLLFYREVHALSYLFKASIPEDVTVFEPQNYITVPFDSQNGAFAYTADEFHDFLYSHDRVLSMKFTPDSEGEKDPLLYLIDMHRNILTALKRAEEAALNREFTKEAEYLVALKKEAEKDYDIRQYITGLLSVKELMYVKAAAEFEEAKNWKEAGEIYESILILNPDNFEANYRLGLIALMLQNVDAAFDYFQTAMVREPNNPKVLFQMGVLMYSRSDYSSALEYLHRAINYNYGHPMAYFYVGLCYEELGRLRNAKEYYTQAQVLDPNNKDIEAQLSRVNKKIDEQYEGWESPERTNQSEEEEGEVIPLPINKNAIEKRIMEEDINKYAPASKGGGNSKYGDKYDKPPGSSGTTTDEKKTFFDLFSAEGQ